MAPTPRRTKLKAEKTEMKSEIPKIHVEAVQQEQAPPPETERAESHECGRPNVQVKAVQHEQAPPPETGKAGSQQPGIPHVHVEAVQQEQAPPSETGTAGLQQPERPHVHVEAVQQKQTPPAQKKGKPRKKRQRFYAAVRRSARFQNTGTPVQNQNVQLEQVTLYESESESEREEEPPQLEENVEAQAVEKTLVEKMDYAVTLLEAMSSQNEQIETLRKENSELSLKLQAALGKIEGFEKGGNATSAPVDFMDKFKDVLLITSLSKASEMAAAIQCHDPKAASSSKRNPKAASSSKRKR